MKLPLFLFFLCGLAHSSNAQNNSKEVKAFLDALNKLATTTTQNHWRYEEPMKADSLFHLNGDTLTVTLKYSTDSSWTRVRMAAPFSKIRTIDWDHYLLLNYHDEDVVRIYEQTNLDPAWKLVQQTDLLHIGAVSEENKKEMKMKEAIEKKFENLKL